MKIMLKRATLIMLLVSCNLAKIDDNKARMVAENLMNDLKNENYAGLDQYYTASFNESEPLNVKEEKFKKLREVMGALKSYELISSKHDDSIDHGGPKVELKYRLTCARIKAIHTVVIINDEGQHKIAFQNFESGQ